MYDEYKISACSLKLQTFAPEAIAVLVYTVAARPSNLW